MLYTSLPHNSDNDEIGGEEEEDTTR